MKPIGINKIRIGKTVLKLNKRISSSFGQVFDNDVQVIVNDGFYEDDQLATIGNIDELYEILNNKINENDDFATKMKIIYDMVTEYFGSFENSRDRLKYYKSEDESFYSDEKNKVSDLKGKNSAMCVERAMVSQNLLKSLGINSFYKTSIIINNGRPVGHAFNLIEYNGKFYIFDATIPMHINNRITPIITEIPKEAFDELTLENELEGFPIKVTHYNSDVPNQEHTIIYDFWSDKKPYVPVRNHDIDGLEK